MKPKFYRIVRDPNLGYEVQILKRFLFFTWWKQCNMVSGTNHHPTIEEAKEWIFNGCPQRPEDKVGEVVWRCMVEHNQEIK